MHPKVALSEGFSQWLDERAGTAARPMDPYGTSLRNTFRTIPWLQALSQGKDIPARTDRAQNQAVSDMKALASLVSRRRGQQDVTLTRMGGLVLNTWESAGALADSDEHEVARCVLLIRLVMRHGAFEDRENYRQLYRNWIELRKIKPAEYWWSDLFHMFLPCYLDWPDSRGYNPFTILLTTTGGNIGREADWIEWEQSETKAGRPGLKNLFNTINNNHRPGGSRNFRRALELIYISGTAPSSLPRTLEEWSLST